ncbi:MAG: (d)CMP kinase [Candidatus Caenarcaniphilales bacterium]|nr:(d)CMP kinase [Candidatus Caenarcaniphilales bacterium]
MASTKKITVAVDGPAGSGKSTVSKLIAQRNNLLYLDTGAMYRAITWLALSLGLDIESHKEQIISATSQATLVLHQPTNVNDSIRVILNQRDITGEIRNETINQNVSLISAIPEIREILVSLQQRLGAEGDVILDGRDIGTVVFPKADLKIYLVASVSERAKRRHKEEREKGMNERTLAEVAAEIEARDYKDMNRKISPLCKAEDAIEINTDGMTIDQVVERIEAEILKIRSTF